MFLWQPSQAHRIHEVIAIIIILYCTVCTRPGIWLIMDAMYLKTTVGSYLAEGLAEVASKRPSDPIEYLGLWLLKQKQNIVNREVAYYSKVLIATLLLYRR